MTMLQIYKGVQTLLSSENPHAIYIPCAGHSLNLVGNKAADCCIEAISFFGTLTVIYFILHLQVGHFAPIYRKKGNLCQTAF